MFIGSLLHRRIQSAAAAAEMQAPPMSNPLTSVWYWMLDGRPTTIMYHKPGKEVWCNGFLIDTYVTTYLHAYTLFFSENEKFPVSVVLKCILKYCPTNTARAYITKDTMT